MTFTLNEVKMFTVDGPEKAGKGTLLRHIETKMAARGFAIVRYHFTKSTPTAGAHQKILQDNLAAAAKNQKTLIIWDRSQASEVVYAKLLNRKSSLVDNALLGEWVVGRAQAAMGYKVMLLGPSPNRLRELRTSDDHPVDVVAEREEFRKYGLAFGWQVIENEHDMRRVEQTAEAFVEALVSRPAIEVCDYTGPLEPDLLFLKTPSEEWQPFSTPTMFTKFAKDGVKALQYGYATIDADRELLRMAKAIVPMTEKARVFAKYYLNHPNILKLS